MVDFTGGTWRSLVDGEEISAIPDPDIYLQDDWGDNKLQDREDGGTTTHNGVEGVYRPEWDVVDGKSEPTVENETLDMSGDDGIYTEINLNYDETITWQLDDLDVGDTGDGSTDWTIVTLATDSEPSNNQDGRVDASYWYGLRDTTRENRLVYRDDDGNDNVIMQEGSLSGDIDSVTIERDSDANWTVWEDGSQVGTTTQQDGPEFDTYVAIIGEDGNDWDIGEIKVS